jgi:hypothetical protein
MHVRLLGQRLQIDVHGQAEALRRQHRGGRFGLAQELDEVLEGTAQHGHLNNGSIGHQYTSLQQCTFYALSEHTSSSMAK